MNTNQKVFKTLTRPQALVVILITGTSAAKQQDLINISHMIIARSVVSIIFKGDFESINLSDTRIQTRGLLTPAALNSVV